MAATVLDPFDVGMFVPLSFLFFALTPDLTVAQVGLSTSIATALSLPAAPAAGTAVDRWGPAPRRSPTTCPPRPVTSATCWWPHCPH